MAYQAHVEEIKVIVDGLLLTSPSAMIFAKTVDPEVLTLQVLIDKNWRTIEIPVHAIKGVLGLGGAPT